MRQRSDGGGREGSRRLGLVRTLPALLLVAGVVLDVATPPDLTAAALFAAAP